MAQIETPERLSGLTRASGRVLALLQEWAADWRKLWSGWFGAAFLGVLAVTLVRVGLLTLDRTDLFVDEAQYWLWSQDLAWGYYSKPPLIAALIGLVTGLAGSDAPFWVRLPAPILHAITALILGAIAARMSRKAAIVVALGYVTLPMVAVGSALMSTDTVMLPLLALALLAFLNAVDQGEPRAARRWAALCGLALGLAFLAKYAAVYFLLGALVAGLTDRSLRLPWRLYLVILSVFGVTVAPNVLWNLQNGLVTLSHTLDNADWAPKVAVPLGAHLLQLMEFVSSQFAVFGPLAFGVLLIALFGHPGPGDQRLRRLALSFCWPVLGVVCLQAFASHAYANWAAAAYIGGSLLVFPVLLEMRRYWLVLSFGLHAVVALALPLTAVGADRLAIGENHLLLERYVGQAAMSRWIIAEARAGGLTTVVAEDRAILADLFYTGRDSGLTFGAVPPQARPRNHYAMSHPFEAVSEAEILYVGLTAEPPVCAAGVAPLAEMTPLSGALRASPVRLFRLPADCWQDRG